MDGRMAYLRPSSAGRWSACGGYIAARVSTIDLAEATGVDVQVREEGTACHWLSELMLTSQPLPEVDSFSPNNVQMVEALWDAVDVYVDAVRPFTRWDYAVESHVRCDIIYPGMQGTGDIIAVDEDNRYIAIRDAKFGYRYVPEDTPQLTIYGAGVLDELGWGFNSDVTIDLGIVQPRVFGTQYDRNRIITGAELWEEVEDLQHKARRAMDPSSPLVAGNHCIDCEVRWECPAFARLAGDAVTVAAVRAPDRLSPSQLGTELVLLETYQKLLEERIIGLKQQAHYLINNGSCVNNYEVVESFGREKFGDDLDKLTAWAKRHHNVDTHVSKPRTPNQVRALLPPEARSEVDKYAFRPENGPELRRVTKKSNRKLDQLIKAGNTHGK